MKPKIDAKTHLWGNFKLVSSFKTFDQNLHINIKIILKKPIA